MMTEEQKQERIQHFREKIAFLERCELTHVPVYDAYTIALAALTQPAGPAFKLPKPRQADHYYEKYPEMPMGDAIIRAAEWNRCRQEAMRLNAPHTAQIEPICATGGAEWVKCSDRMPDELQDVLVTDGSEVKICWFNGEFWDGPFIVGGMETHWMPLPLPPDT